VIELYDSLPTHFPVMSLSLDKFSNVQWKAQIMKLYILQFFHPLLPPL
jgi:hypothetical protein